VCTHNNNDVLLDVFYCVASNGQEFQIVGGSAPPELRQKMYEVRFSAFAEAVTHPRKPKQLTETPLRTQKGVEFLKNDLGGII
jgi:hypothetical protein